MDLIRQLEEQMRVFGVSTRRFPLTEEAFRTFDGGLQQYFFQNFNHMEGLQNALTYCEEKTVYVLTDQFELHNYSFLIPSACVAEGEKEMITIGPFLTESPKQLLPQVVEDNRLTPGQAGELEEFFYSIPLIREKEAFESLIFLQIDYIYGNKGDIQINRIEEYYGQKIQTGMPKEKEEPRLSMKVLEERYDQEEELMAAIARGNMEQAYEAQKKLAFRHLNLRDGYSTLREAKNMMIVSNTLYRKAVQAAAVHPFYIDSISRSFAKRIEECVFVKELDDLGHEMVRKYCMLVRNHSLIGYSQIVRDVINYIECNIKEPMTLKELAEISNVSVSYLAVRFKKEVGKSVVDYINEKRVFAAIRYLTTTDLTIAEVAECVGINDENYFSRLFKKYQGRTPKQYRNLMQAKM